jgi:hypothetical protein
MRFNRYDLLAALFVIEQKPDAGSISNGRRNVTEKEPPVPPAPAVAV